MYKFRNQFIVGFIIIIISTVFIFNNITSNGVIRATKGVLNLKEVRYNQSKSIKIAGQWNLYYNKFLSPNEVQNTKSENYYDIPGRLREQDLGRVTTGYMTLHLKIIVPKDDVYGMKIDSMFTASDIWINGVYYGGHGKVGKSISEEKAIYKPQYLFFNSNKEVVDIVINTSTFRDIEPNLQSSLFGTKSQIMDNLYKNIILDVTTNTVLLLMFVFLIGTYFTVNKKKENLYFSIICLIMFLRGLFINGRIFVQIFPNIPYEVLSKTVALTFYLFITFYVLFLNNVFDNKVKFKKTSIVFGAIFTMLCLFTKNTVYDRMGTIGQGICIIVIIYIFYFLISESIKKNKKAQLNLISFTIIAITAINDILVYTSILNNCYLIKYGMLVFITMEFILIMKDNSEEHKKLDKLYKDGMTGLYNNEYIKNGLNKEIIKNTLFSIIMIDIDDFKNINDSYGHLFGDKVIIEVAAKLEAAVDTNGYVSRYGGDEFLILLPKFSKCEAVNISNLIMASVKELNKNYDNKADITLSIGVYENQVKSVEECINNVDRLLYEAKRHGKDCYVVN